MFSTQVILHVMSMFSRRAEALRPWCQDFPWALGVDFSAFDLGSSVQGPQQVHHVQLFRLETHGH